MAGHELVTEGFAEGQVGSSAMPHKMNTRSCERVNGLAVVLRGHLSMVSRAGRRPVERGRRLLLRRTPGGAARRVLRHRRAVPDLPHRARRVRRLPGGDPARARPLPAVPGHHQGADGRGARAASAARPRTRRSRSTRSRWRSRCARAATDNDLFDRLAADPRLGLDRPAIAALVRDPIEFTGAARSQTRPSYAGSRRWSPATPRPRRTPRARSSEGRLLVTVVTARSRGCDIQSARTDVVTARSRSYDRPAIRPPAAGPAWPRAGVRRPWSPTRARAGGRPRSCRPARA